MRAPAAWRSWQRERFPARNLVFFALFHATALVVARAAVATGPVAIGARDLPGFVALCAFFLLLRVFDEHKDFAADAIAHPERALQRGLVTLAQLRRVGLAAVLVSAGVSLWLDGGVGEVTRWWLVALAWSLLMAREFFVRDWLRARLMAYALTHLAVMPVLACWAASMGAATATRTPAVWAFGCLAFLGGLVFEVARKLRAPAQEHPMADSYTQSLGVRGATRLLLVALAGCAAAAMTVTWLLVGNPGAPAVGLVLDGVVLAAAVLAAAGVLARFRAAPTPDSAKRSEAAAGIAALATHMIVVASVLAARGMVVR